MSTSGEYIAPVSFHLRGMVACVSARLLARMHTSGACEQWVGRDTQDRISFVQRHGVFLTWAHGSR